MPFKVQIINTKIIWNVLNFCGKNSGNINTNSGGILYQEKTNTITKLKYERKRDIIGVDCDAHFIHKRAQGGHDIVTKRLKARIV
jgi:hypothetical protein